MRDLAFPSRSRERPFYDAVRIAFPKYPLTSKNSPPILHPLERNVLSGATSIKGVKALVEYPRKVGKNHG